MKWEKVFNQLVQSIFIRICLFYLTLIFLSCNKEVSVTPPDAPPPGGIIFISSNPPGFNIYLDNKERRRATPDSLKWLSAGTYQLTLKKDLWRDTSFIIMITEIEKGIIPPVSVNVDYTLDPAMKGQINCNSNPKSSQIFLNDSLVNILSPGTLKVLPGNYYVRFHKDKFRDDSVLVAVSSGNVSTAQLTLVDTTIWQDFTNVNSSIPSLNLSCVAVDKNNIMYIGTPDDYAFSFNGSIWKPFSTLPNNKVTCFTIDNNNVLYAGTYKGFTTFDGSNYHIYSYMSSGLPDFFVEAIAIDQEGDRIIGTHTGLTVFDNLGNWTVYGSANIPDTYITALDVDIKDSLWVGMQTGGIARRSRNKALDVAWQVYNVFNSNLISNNVTAIKASPTGEVWVGFDKNTVFGNGLSYFNGTSWTNVYPIPPSSRTNAILIDKNNVKWVATDEGVVMFTSPSSATIFNNDNTGLNINHATGLAEDSFGNIWISTDAGLIKYKGNH